MGLADQFPDLYAMLQVTAAWQTCTGEDQWGNETWADPVPVQCFIESQAVAFGGTDEQNKSDGRKIVTMNLITDAIGAQLRDKVTVAGETLYVESLDVPKDEQGLDLYSIVTASTVKKG